MLASLNDRFQMDGHGGLFFTMWYGVYCVSDRTLTYSSAGHHPAFLVAANKGAANPLGMPAMVIGMMPDVEYETHHTTVSPGSSVYLYQ